jgi:hypothetical protein
MPAETPAFLLNNSRYYVGSYVFSGAHYTSTSFNFLFYNIPNSRLNTPDSRLKTPDSILRFLTFNFPRGTYLSNNFFKHIHMQIVKTVLLAASTLAVAYGAQAQTADEIIAKHVAAIGGTEKLNGLTSLYVETTTEVMGNEMNGSTTILNGKGYKMEGEVMGSKVVNVITDKGGWSINPMGGGGAQALPEEAAKQAKDQLYIGGPLLNYAAKGYTAELKGQEKIGAVNAFKLVLSSKDAGATTYYIDPATYYIIKMVKTANMMGQQMEVAATYSDYKKTDYGFVYPYSTEMDMGGQFSMTSKVNKIEVNKAVDPKAFDMPK